MHHPHHTAWAMVVEMELLTTIILLSLMLAALATNHTAPGAGGFSLRLVATNHDPAATAIRPPMVGPLDMAYSVVVGAGGHDYHLVLSLRMSLTWMRCKPCAPELRQQGEIFDPKAHASKYLPIPSNSPLCGPPNPLKPDKHACAFHLPLADGHVGLATFKLGSEDVHGVVLGCAHSTKHFANHHTFAGVLGLGKLPTSLLLHLRERAHLRFSYCLPGGSRRPADHHGGFLRFDGDVPRMEGRAVHSTGILRTWHEDESAYYVRLTGVGVGGERVPGVDAETFKRQPRSGKGGCVVDSGAGVTSMVAPAYAKVEEHVRALLERHGARRVDRPPGFGYGLYVEDTPEVRRHLPSLTLHFTDGAQLRGKHEQLFATVDKEICLAVRPDPEMTVIGARQQVDMRFVFDLQEGKITFGPEDCHLDKGTT